MSIFNKYSKMHFIGVGGVSMSALAMYAVTRGVAVSGSDRAYSDYYAKAVDAGVDAWLGEDAERMPKDALVVYSSAIAKDNAELKEARLVGMESMERLTFLSMVEGEFCTSVAVAGTHGKTTVTAMLSSIFSYHHMHYTAHIGGTPIGSSNLVVEGTEVFLTEACEYKKSLLALSPTYAIVNNLEYDHPDTYQDMAELLGCFGEFVSKTSLKCVVMPHSLKLAHIDIFNYAHILTFGKGGDADVESIFPTDEVGHTFCIRYRGLEPFRVSIHIPGMHNVYNALAAATLALAMGIDVDSIQRGLAAYGGVDRRFSKKGMLNGADVYVDYAHHPSEIKAAIATAKALSKGQLYVVFQPHTYSRTARLFEDFVECFEGADKLIITASYSARESLDKGLAAIDLYREISRTKMYCSYYEKLLPIAQNLAKNVKKGDFVLILGAGDVDNLAKIIMP